jgi:hypothetical protein
MHDGMAEVNPTFIPVYAEGVTRHAVARLSAAHLPATVDNILEEIDQMPEQVVRACVVAQQRAASPAAGLDNCDNVGLIDQVARSTRGRSVANSHAAYSSVEVYLDAENIDMSTLPPVILGGATMATLAGGSSSMSGATTYNHKNMYRYDVSGGGTAPTWSPAAALEVRGELLSAGINQATLDTPSVAQWARECYEYNPAIIPYFATAINQLGAENANLGTAVLIRDLQDNYGWIDKQITAANLATAEHMRVQGEDPTIKAVQSYDLTSLTTPPALDANKNIIPPGSGHLWQRP